MLLNKRVSATFWLVRHETESMNQAKFDMDLCYIFRNVQRSELWSIIAGSLPVLITGMNESTPPQSPHNPDIRKCIICQKDKDNKGSTENGRDKIISNSIYLEDKILWVFLKEKLDEVHQPEDSSSTAQSTKPSCARPKRLDQ